MYTSTTGVHSDTQDNSLPQCIRFIDKTRHTGQHARTVENMYEHEMKGTRKRRIYPCILALTALTDALITDFGGKGREWDRGVWEMSSSLPMYPYCGYYYRSCTRPGL